MRNRKWVGIAAMGMAASVTLAVGRAQAVTVATFNGADAGSGTGGTRTNSDAAATSFFTAAGLIGTVAAPITFENQPIGGLTNLTVASGVVLTNVK